MWTKGNIVARQEREQVSQGKEASHGALKQNIR